MEIRCFVSISKVICYIELHVTYCLELNCDTGYAAVAISFVHFQSVYTLHIVGIVDNILNVLFFSLRVETGYNALFKDNWQ